MGTSLRPIARPGESLRSTSGPAGRRATAAAIWSWVRWLVVRYLRPDLLIIDDMGMKQLPKRSGEYLFEIIMRRHQTRSTVMTSNRPLEDWGKLLGDVPSASAILDRFLHHAEIIAFQGRSYRLRNRLGDDPKPTPKPADNPKPASADRQSPAETTQRRR